MARKGYNEGCFAAHALDLFGDRWALLVMRELMLGPKRFGTIKAGAPGIATNILTRRLEDLEAAALIRRQQLPPPASAQVYALTEAGADARGVIEALFFWGLRHLAFDPARFLSPTSLMLAMGFMAKARAREGLLPVEPILAGYVLGPETFSARLDAEGFHVHPSGEAGGAVVFHGAPASVALATFGPLPLARACDEGLVRVDGDLAQGQTLVSCFTRDR